MSNTIEPVMSYSLRGSEDSSRNYMIFSRKSFEDAGYKVPNVPKRWDESWGMHFPDWDGMSDALKADIHAISDVAIETSGLSDFYCGPGRAFGTEPSCKIGKRFIVVYQTVGLDI